jgi:hypothetical protein
MGFAVRTGEETWSNADADGSGEFARVGRASNEALLRLEFPALFMMLQTVIMTRALRY